MTDLRLVDRYDFNADDLADPWGTGVVRCERCGDYHDPACPDDVEMVPTRSGWVCWYCMPEAA